MKKMLSICMFLLFFQYVQSFSQPSNEIGCMSNFDYDNAGNSKVNAYLLMMLNHFMCPHFTINKPEDDPLVTELHSNPQKFKEAFINKVGHYFSQTLKG
ncbi:MAG TPA: hypothetical protein VFD56_09315, partial [Chitinophagaceae bacterium]|nr:hypothetical protein [Chitinophagaceae bacterium]